METGTTVNDGTRVILVVNRIEERFTIGVSINVNSLTSSYVGTSGNQGTSTGDGTVEGGTTGENGATISEVRVQVNDEVRTGVSITETAYDMGGLTFTGKKGESLEVKLTITDPSNGEIIHSTSRTVRFGTDSTATFN